MAEIGLECIFVGLEWERGKEMACFEGSGMAVGNTGIRECFLVELKWEQWSEVRMAGNGCVGMACLRGTGMAAGNGGGEVGMFLC